MYLVSKTTKEHFLARNFSACDANDSDLFYVPADADGWIKWDGSTSLRPVSDFQKYEAQTRDGRFVSIVRRWLNCNRIGQKLDSDIIAYRPILTEPAKPQAWVGVEPEWNGEGLPPVGTVCEVDFGEGSGNWKKCEVIAHFMQPFGKVAAFTVDDKKGKLVDAYGVGCFRPTPTKRDQWVEAAIECVKDITGTLYEEANPGDAAACIYEAIANGTLPAPEKK